MKPRIFKTQLHRDTENSETRTLVNNRPLLHNHPLRAIALTALTLLTLTAVDFSTASLASLPKQQQTRISAKQSKSQIITEKINEFKQSNQRWIEIRLKEQRLLAWSGDQYVYGATVSTGKATTPTLTGVFAVQTKLRTTRMRGADYNIPDVPYTMYYDGGYAIHGAYWHNRFGTPISHGCINLKPEQARWLFNWAKVGTPVVIRK